MRFRCTTCQEEKDASAFTASFLKRKSKICRDCKAEYNRRWYEENKAAHMRNVRRTAKRLRDQAMRFVHERKSQPCADCKRRFPPVAMDFDHVRGTKFEIVSKLTGRLFSIKRLLEEVEKCDVVCANCHRIRTAKRLIQSGKRLYCTLEELESFGADEPP